MNTNNIKGYLLLAKFDDGKVRQIIIHQDLVKYHILKFAKIKENELLVTDTVGIDFEIPENK